MTPRQRWIIIGGLLLATLAAALLVDPPPAADNAQSANTEGATRSGKNRRARGDEAAPAKDTAAEPASPELASAAAPASAVPLDPFRSQTWVVAPPPAPPPKPVAPPLPFQYLGKVSGDDGVRVFLSTQGKYLIVKVGDVINGVYSVESIAGGRMTLVYQPLKEKQVLSIGDDK